MKTDTDKCPLTPINPLGWIRRALGIDVDRHRIEPYVSRRDLNNGPDTCGENEPRPAAEIGVKISF